MVWPALRDLATGRVVFTMPPEPAPCGATALKPLLMACDHWQRAGVLADLDVSLVLPRSSPIGVPSADDRLEAILTSYGVDVLRSAQITAVGDRRLTVSTRDGDRELDDTPTWSRTTELPRGSRNRALPARRAWSTSIPRPSSTRRHASIWAIGDAADVATRPSGGALRTQVDVLAHNLTRAEGAPPRRYDGYTAMPITTSRHRLTYFRRILRGQM